MWSWKVGGRDFCDFCKATSGLIEQPASNDHPARGSWGRRSKPPDPVPKSLAPEDPGGRMNIEERLEQAYKRMEGFKDAYYKANPEWFKIAFWRLIYDAVVSLRTYIEDPEEGEISWDSPFVMLQYAVGADVDLDTILEPVQKLADLPEQPPEKWAGIFADSWLESHSVGVLQYLCGRDIAYIKEGYGYTLAFSEECKQRLQDLSKKEQEKEVGRLLDIEPFTLEIKGKDDHTERAIKAFLGIQCNPLVIDKDQKSAYYPIQIGIDFKSGLDVVRESTENEQVFWESVLEDIKQRTPKEKLDFEFVFPKPIAKLVPKSFFTISTGSLLPFLQFFGSKKSVEPTDIIRGAVEVREYMRFDAPSSTVKIRTLFDGNAKFEAERFEQEMVRALGPAGLKVVMGLFRLAHDRGRIGYFTLDTNDFLDGLGYTRSTDGYHQTENIRRVYETIEVLKRVKVVGEFRRRLKSGRDKVSMHEEQLVYQLSTHTEWITERDKPVDSGEKVSEGVTLLINPKVYADITEHLYTWVDKKCLSTDAHRHPYAIQLIPFYAIQWRMGWAKYQGVYRAKLGVILRGAGIPAPKGRHWARLIDRIKREHDYMVEQGLIKSWRIVERASKEINALWEVVIPDGHALRELKAKSGEEAE